MLVRDIMYPSKITLEPAQNIHSAWQQIVQTRQKGIPVTDNYGQVVGILTQEDIINAGPQVGLNAVAVQDIMQVDFCYLEEDLPLSEVWIRPFDIFPVMDCRGQVSGILCRSDVGHAMYTKASQLFQQAETIMDSAHNGIIAIDQEGIITVFNKAAEKITRREKNEAIGQHLSKVLIPHGLLDVLKAGKYQSGYKFTVTYSSGSHTYLTNRSPVVENGEVVGALGVFQDVSELEFISEELNSVKQLNQELRTVIESSYDGILVINSQGEIVRANQAMGEIVDIDPQKLHGMNIKDIFENNDHSHRLLETIIKNGDSFTLTDQTANQDNLLITGNPVLAQDGQIDRAVINVRNMTDLKELQLKLEQSVILSQRYHHELTQLRGKLMEHDGIVASSVSMQRIMRTALQVAQVDSTVLLLGESGVGKEVVAKTIHKHSKRGNGPFIIINCGAIPENLLESELFGYEKGAFTGAKKEGKAGLIELADNGTLLFDEIGDLPLNYQVKLLRVLQERIITRVGGTKQKPVNFRIIAATNRPLEKLVQQGVFREDLYFRLNVVPMTIPPLRERKDDIIPLIHLFKTKLENSYGLQKDFTPQVFESLLEYHWPGNIREVKNVVERLLVTSPEEVIRSLFKPLKMAIPSAQNHQEVIITGIMPLKKAQLEMERQLIGVAMKELGSTYKVAQELRVNQSTIVRKINRMKKHGLTL